MVLQYYLFYKNVLGFRSFSWLLFATTRGFFWLQCFRLSQGGVGEGGGGRLAIVYKRREGEAAGRVSGGPLVVHKILNSRTFNLSFSKLEPFNVH